MHFCLLGRFDFFSFTICCKAKVFIVFRSHRIESWKLSFIFWFFSFTVFFCFSIFCVWIKKKKLCKKQQSTQVIWTICTKIWFWLNNRKKLLMKCFLWVFFSLVSKMSIMVIADNTNKHIIIRLISTICFCFETTVNQNLLHSFYFHISFLSFVSFHFAIA